MNRNTKILTIVIVVVAVCAIAFFGIRNQMKQHSSDDKNVIKIGAILAMTGPGAEYGQEALDALKTAILYNQDLCKKNNVRFELVVEDSKTVAKDGLNAYNAIKLKHPDISVVFSHASAVTNLLSSYSKKDKMILVAEATNSTPAENNPFYYINQIDDYVTSKLLLDHATDVDKILLFYLNDDFGSNIYKKMKDAGSVKVDGVSFEHTSNLKDIVAKASINNYKKIAVAGYGMSSVNIIREIKSAGYSGIVLVSPGLLTVENKKILKDYASNVFFVVSEIPGEDIARIYKENFGRTFFSSTSIDFFSAGDAVIKSYNMVLEDNIPFNKITSTDIKNKLDTQFLNVKAFPFESITNQRFNYKGSFKTIDGERL
ncbi:MAG: ABC transporter substrate-binding protein [Lentisphaeria bacterium]|nr:ABC transporter substrate-binding protein [Lentisphaeria bacterium]